MLEFKVFLDEKKRIRYIRSEGFKIANFDETYGFKEPSMNVLESRLPIYNDAEIIDFAMLQNKLFIATYHLGEVRYYKCEIKYFTLFASMTDFVKYMVLYNHLSEVHNLEEEYAELVRLEFKEPIDLTCMEYKGYKTKMNYSAEDRLFNGVIEDIRDLITIEAKDYDTFATEFHKAVDDYILFCKEVNKTPDQPK